MAATLAFNFEPEIRRIVRAEMDLVDSDLSRFVAQGYGDKTITVCYQRPDDEREPVYRGIRHDGQWLVDHYPDWHYVIEPPPARIVVA